MEKLHKIFEKILQKLWKNFTEFFERLSENSNFCGNSREILQKNVVKIVRTSLGNLGNILRKFSEEISEKTRRNFEKILKKFRKHGADTVEQFYRINSTETFKKLDELRRNFCGNSGKFLSKLQGSLEKSTVNILGKVSWEFRNYFLKIFHRNSGKIMKKFLKKLGKIYETFGNTKETLKK